VKYRRDPPNREHPWLAAFLKALARENVAAREDVAPATVRAYRSDLGLFAAWYGGHPFEKHTASDLAHFRQYMSFDRTMKPPCAGEKVARESLQAYTATMWR